MKLRYFLRGLGTGIIFSAVLMSLYGTMNNKMSDEEIRKAALKLGMVEKQDALDVVLGLSGSEKPESTTGGAVDSEKESTPKPSEDVEATEEVTTEPVTEKPTNSPDVIGDILSSTSGVSKTDLEQAKKTEEPVALPTRKPTKKPVVTKKPEVKKESTTYVSMEIKSGMWSDEISRKLAELELVDNAEAFDKYLSENGYESNIKVGSYRIPVGATYQQIAEIITE